MAPGVSDWFPPTDGLTVRPLPPGPGVFTVNTGDGFSYPVGAEAVFYNDALPVAVREQELAWHIERRARERGATEIYVSETHDREVSQVFGEPHPLAVDGKIKQMYCYVAYITPEPEAA